MNSNTYYLLLDSSLLEVSNLSYFNLHEITNRDAFRVRYKDGKNTGGPIAIESIASVFQMARFSSYYPPGVPIQDAPLVSMRGVIPLDVIEHASNLFARVVASPGLEKSLASFAKSLSEYKVGNYETCVVLSWFTVEATIKHLWEAHIDSLNCNLQGGGKRINSERREYLTRGRDFPISIISHLLELWDVLPNPLFRDIDAVRRLRNQVVHPRDHEPNAEEAQLTMKTAHAMIELRWGLHFVPNTIYSVSGL